MPDISPITFAPLTPSLGAEVHGLDLSRPATEAEFAQLSVALAEHGVLVFRDQRISPQQHVDISRHFG